MEPAPNRHQTSHRIRNGPRATAAFWRPEIRFAGPLGGAASAVSIASAVVWSIMTCGSFSFEEGFGHLGRGNRADDRTVLDHPEGARRTEDLAGH